MFDVGVKEGPEDVGVASPALGAPVDGRGVIALPQDKVATSVRGG